MDIKTQIICLVAVNFLLGGFMFVSARIHTVYRGYGYWAFGNLGLACGWLLIAVRGHIPGLLSIVGASSLFAAVAVLHLVGLQIFLGLRPRYGHFWSVPVMILLLAGFTYVHDLTFVRVSGVSGFVTVYILLTANLLRKNIDADNAPIYTSMIALYLVNVAALAWRGFSWLIWPRPGGIFQSAFSDNMYFLLQLGTDVSWVIFFFAMNARRMNLEVKRQNLELQEAAGMTDRFLSVLAHDLRGPVGNLVSGLETCRDEYGRLPAAETRRLLDALAGRAAAAFEQLESLLAWGMDGAGRAVFKPRQVCLFNIVKKEIIRIPDSKGLALINEVEPEALVYADPDMVAVVVRNLLYNAVKFSHPDGKVQADLSLSREGALVTVSDEGVGIPKERLERLFRAGEAGSSKGTDGEPGTGMGLALCEGFIKKHGGRIWAESDGKRGSRFMFTLPAEPKEAGAKSSFQAVTRVDQGNKPR